MDVKGSTVPFNFNKGKLTPPQLTPMEAAIFEISP